MMERWRNTDNDVRSFLPIVPLFLRISAEHVRHQQKERMKRFQWTCVGLLAYMILIWLCRYDNQLYNIVNEPLHVTPLQLAEHIELQHQRRHFWNRFLFSFYTNYFQIELGENHIKPIQNHPFLQLVTESTVVQRISPHHLYVKLASQEQKHSHTRLPFHFQLFSIRTLKCIVRQIKIPPREYHTWLEKSVYIRVIEEYYDQHASLFNKNVLIQCGIIMGYLYHPRGEHQLIETASSNFDIHSMDVAIDASSSYSIVLVILLCSLFSGLVFIGLIHLFLYIYYHFRPTRINIHSGMQSQFQMLGIHSLHSLTDLIYESVLQRLTYRSHMFIVDTKYLLIFNVDFDEQNTQKLRLFYNQSPFSVIPIPSIIEVCDIDFIIDDGCNRKRIYFSSISRDVNDINAGEWLHNQLMQISASYRTRYVEMVRYEHEQDRYARRFASIVAREADLQRMKIANSLDRMLGIVQSASPNFIAQFCLTEHPTVQSDQIDLLNSNCTVCLNEFRLATRYAQWPCPAGHYFHCECMLGVLRESNKCPLCRFTVQSTPSFFQNIFSRFV